MKQKLGGLKCDTPHCNYVDPDIPIEDYPKWIDHPCPVCGRSLLTQEDYDAFMKMLEISKKSEEFNLKHPLLSKIFNKKYSVTFHGNGFRNIEIKKVKN